MGKIQNEQLMQINRAVQDIIYQKQKNSPKSPK